MIGKREVTASMVSLVVAVVFTVAALDAPADFKMHQSFTTGRVTNADNRVNCNDPGGFAHWDTRSISIRHNTANQGAGKATALQAAMASWTNVPDSAYVLTYAGTTSAGFVTDGTNSLSWGACPGGCIALTALVLQSGQKIIESDVVFNNGSTWTTNGSVHDTESVAAHELGHLLGIHHPNTASGPETMSTPYWGTGQRSLHADDIAALQCSEHRYCASGSTPAPPVSLSVEPGWCFGHNDLTWTNSCEGITRYELYRSTSPTFSSQTLEYSGLNQSRHVVVSGTTYYRVRACNAVGCGSYKAAGSAATYHSGCL